MITVKEILHLPELQRAVVRAGKSGLGRNIQWAHVIDHDDAGYFLEGGELLLTCGQIWPKDQEAQTRILNLFLSHQISGIVFAVGRYMDECPKEAVEFGGKYAIPILEIPFQVPFVKVTRSIHQEIMKRQYKKVELAAKIPFKLKDKLKEAKSSLEVCDILAENLKCPIILTDFDNKIMARSFPSVGESINISKITNDLMAALDGCVPPYHQFDSLNGEVQSVRIPTDSLPVIIGAPIQNENEYFGTLWLFDLYKQGEQGRVRMLEHAVSILKEHIVHKKDNEAKCRQLQAELLGLLFKNPKIASIIVEEELKKLGLDAKENWLTGVIPFAKGLAISRDSSSLYDLCKNWFEETSDVTGFCELYEGNLVLILTFNGDLSQLENHLKNLQSLLYEKMDAPLLLGGVKTELFSLKESYKEAVSLSSIIPNACPTEELYFADRYRREIMLYRSLDSVQATELRSLILPKELMPEHGDILYETLKCLMLNQYNRERAAKLLHIHRNTLRYRIEKIEQFLGESLNLLRCQFWIQIAFDLEPLAASVQEVEQT